MSDSELLCDSQFTLANLCPLHPPPLPPPPHTAAAKKFKKLAGKETYSETLESTPTMEKEKFPQDYFPEVGARPGSLALFADGAGLTPGKSV